MKRFQATELAADSLTCLDVLVEDIGVVILCELMSVDLRIVYLFRVLGVKMRKTPTCYSGQTASAPKRLKKEPTLNQ